MKKYISQHKTNYTFSEDGLVISKMSFCLWILLVFTGFILIVTVPAQADNNLRIEMGLENSSMPYTLSENIQIPPDTLSFWDTFRTGKLNLDIRMRGELVGQPGVNNAQAVTNKVQLGYETNSFRGFSGYIDFVNLFAFTPDHYNAAGLNNQPGYAVVADPELTVLNQYYLQYHWQQTETEIRAGRQRIIHDDARFIGNVGWRQNEQTYDAVSVQTTFGSTPLHAFYSYVWQVNRIFGPEHSAGVMDSNSHLFHLSYKGISAARLSGYIYLLEFQEFESLSVQTFGARLDGTVKFDSQSAEWNYLASYGIQNPSSTAAVDYTVSHLRVNSIFKKLNIGQIGLGYEVFGNENGATFKTPLATLHAYQGWADSFLTIPAGGLRDIHLKASFQMPFDANFKARYHWFKSYENNLDLGRELDLALGKKLHENLNFLLKYASYDAIEYGRNSNKFWIQLQLKI